ncbi:Cof-type HAD-IIB family hydrolase [Novosphingobium sp. AP12]|uniref:Cof-type HAD-IIB family hydrolase n=1 Tax=Novosphingobium sp. AP12 TaxID=1144305 RepID=UPI00027200B3|nr:Cof-type HAD-IIB family hydrolase [Novosphingobium sp. AP12]EJL22743.1 HAD-superfamily hydrolase, subfamily IIB [Novosphingobium sp. AP12]
MIRLLVSDIDGTLVRSDKSLAPATVAAARKLVAAGVPMSLISARPPSGIGWIAEEIGLPGPFGAFNGGTVFMRDGTVVERHGLEAEVARGVIELVCKAGITCWVFADGLWYSNSADDPYNLREVKAANVQPVITQDFTAVLGRVDKIVGVSPDDQRLTTLADAARDIAGARATIARSQTYYLDVTAPRANKGDGISHIAAAFGVPLEDVAVIGDQANDLPMFARAGFSIAMGQATDEVKAHADHVTASSDDDGVARAIEALLNGDYGPGCWAAAGR